MIDYKQFNILYELLQNPAQSLRYYAEKLKISLGSLHASTKQLEEAALIHNLTITENGLRVLQPYKVDNVLIMAAGMSTRMAPLSLEKPKGLMEVKGEILIERMIKQIHEVGIKDITIVLGYMKEKFFYLEDKYNVKFIINEDYYRYNNTSTLMVAEHELKNTYISCADLLFTKNVFQSYEFRPFLSSIFFPERVIEHGLVCSKDNRVKSMNYIAENQWCWFGNIYFDKAFSKKYMEILKKEFSNPLVQSSYVQDVLMHHIKEFEFYAKKYPQNVIYEFDSLNDLRKYDPSYINNTNFNVIGNISKALNCSQNKILNIEPIKNSKRNLFAFQINDVRYFYEYPMYPSKEDNQREVSALNFLTQTGVQHSALYIDKQEGWKILKYETKPEPISFAHKENIKKAISYLKGIHSLDGIYDTDFDLWENIQLLKSELEDTKKINFEEFSQLYDEIVKVYHSLKPISKKVFSHGSAIIDNFYLIDDKIELSLWKNAHMTDPAFDLGSLLCFAPYSVKEIEEFIQLYHTESPISQELLQHYKNYFVIVAFYWYLVLLQKDREQYFYVGTELYNCYSMIKKLKPSTNNNF